MKIKTVFAALATSALATGAAAQTLRLGNGGALGAQIPTVRQGAQPRTPTLMCPDLAVSLRSVATSAGKRTLYVSLTNVGTRPFRSTPGLQRVFLEFRQGPSADFDVDYPFTDVDMGETIEFSIEYDIAPNTRARAEIVLSPNTRLDDLRTNDECHVGNNLAFF